jgi:hypothetical protein
MLNQSQNKSMRLFAPTLLFIASIPSAKAIQPHPRLILTPDRVTTLSGSSTTTHQHLWQLAYQSAEDFRTEPIPAMADAHNRYRYLGDTMPALGLAYLVTHEPQYLDAAVSWITAMLAVPEWKGSQNLGRSAWATGCALLYDWLYDELDEELRNRLRDRLIRESRLIIEDASYWRVLSNHLFNETAALGLVGLSLDGEAEGAEEILAQADQWTEDIIEYAPRDGSWGEGVQYWQYGLSHFVLFLEAAATAGYKDYISDYGWLEQTIYFPIHFSLPGRPLEVLNFSDCNSGGYKPPFIPYLLASWYENGYYQDYGNRVLREESHKFSWIDFLAYDPSVQPVTIHELPTLKHFSDNDFVAMRSDWSDMATIVGFRSGPAPGHRNQNNPERVEKQGFGPGHSHPDINSFCLFAHGEWLAIDPGYTHHKLTANHNTILVNGHGQAGAGQKWMQYMEFEAREPAPAILRVESNPIYDYVLGDAGNIYIDEAELQSFRRHLLFLKPDMILILDDLEARVDSRFEWLLHGRESIIETGTHEYEIVRNGVRLWVHPIQPEAYQAEIQERELDASDVNGKIVTLNLKTESIKRARFLVALCALPDESSPAPRIKNTGGKLSIKHQDQKWTVGVLQPAEIVHPSNPVFVVRSPRVKSEEYSFVRH